MKDLKNKQLLFLLFVFSITSNCSLINNNMKMKKNEKSIANQLTEIGISTLFQYIESTKINFIWQDGQNKTALLNIVLKVDYDDYTRLLASEILFLKDKNYPAESMHEVLAYIYAKALFISGDTSKSFRISGNFWGFMYFSDENGINDFGIIGTHLMTTKDKAIPYLVKLLTNSEILFYEGSQDATIGNGLKYRVKDAAAYYIGKISGIPVKYHENFAERDLEIERLKEKLK
jgi:hypothetical protein